MSVGTPRARDLLRAIVHEIVLDPDKSEGEITFHAIPRLRGAKRTGDGFGNDERTHLLRECPLIS